MVLSAKIKKIEIGRKKYPVRIMVPERHTHSIENPNPNWRNLGEEWINFTLTKWKQGIVYDVAYIPHTPLEIVQGNKTHNILPTLWELEELPNAANFSMGGGNNTFRLNGSYQHPSGPITGSKKNIDLSPIEDKAVILELLKVAEKIYSPPNDAE